MKLVLYHIGLVYQLYLDNYSQLVSLTFNGLHYDSVKLVSLTFNGLHYDSVSYCCVLLFLILIDALLLLISVDVLLLLLLIDVIDDNSYQ